MLNYLWGAMLLVGVVYGAFQGRLPELTAAALDSAKDAVSLCITMTGVMSLWVGLMEIAQKSGMIRQAAGKLQPFINFMFPGIPKGHKAREYITTNIIANIFGLGWAATPAGLKAMEALEELEEERRKGRAGKPGRKAIRPPVPKGTASNEMCTFLIINISSLQLIPVNIIAYRSQYGSVNPAAIVGPAIVATMVSTAVAVVYCKVMDGKGAVAK
ncbi:MAG: nucleoside recognition protein [Lachnospiraceae bacterium]|jgi:spore maturation protein A|nr:nucleoside recognition protein [Lachnospiraceae bacterium]